MNEEAEIRIPELENIPVSNPFPMNPHDWRDGLLVRTPNWLGDAVMTFPAMRQLKKLLPRSCGLFTLCPSGLAPLYRALDLVDVVIPLRDAHAFPSWREWQSIRSLHSGACVLFNNSLRDAMALKAACIPRLFGASARCRGVFLTRSLRFPARRDRVLNKPHQAAKYLALASLLGAEPWDGELPEVSPRIEKEVLSPRVAELLSREKLLVLAPGAAYGDAKRWPSERFHAVAEEWIGRGGAVVSVGSRTERGVAERTLAGLPSGQTDCLAGETTLEELMLLLKHSAAVVANDSGVMHLGGALGAKGVAVFGSTDCAATSPVSRRWRIVYRKLSCSPCFRRVCPKGSKECFDAVRPESVIRALESLGAF